MATVTTLENVLARLALMESSVTHVPIIFLDFHSVKVFNFYQKYYYLLFLYLFLCFIECKCDGDGSLDGKCDDAGKCSCKPGFDGVKCNSCAKKFFGFPQCQGIFFFFFSKINVIFSILSILCRL